MRSDEMVRAPRRRIPATTNQKVKLMSNRGKQKGQAAMAGAVAAAMVGIVFGATFLPTPTPHYAPPKAMGTLASVKIYRVGGFLAPPDTAVLTTSDGSRVVVQGDGPSEWHVGQQVTMLAASPKSTALQRFMHGVHRKVCIDGKDCQRVQQ